MPTSFSSEPRFCTALATLPLLKPINTRLSTVVLAALDSWSYSWSSGDLTGTLSLEMLGAGLLGTGLGTAGLGVGIAGLGLGVGFGLTTGLVSEVGVWFETGGGGNGLYLFQDWNCKREDMSLKFELEHIKTYKMSEHSMKTQISLRICQCAVWSEFLLSACVCFGFLVTHREPRKTDHTVDLQAVLSPCWAYLWLCRFCCVWL